MTKEMKLTMERSIVTPDSRPCGAKSVFEQKFLIEKNAKNQAYYFIIKSGLMREFLDFSATFHCADPFDECINLLSNQ